MKRMIFAASLIFGLLGTGIAQAQQTWYPSYNSDEVLQVDPLMANRPGINFSSDFAWKIHCSSRFFTFSGVICLSEL